MNLTTLELDTLYFYFIKLGHFIPTVTPLGFCLRVTVNEKPLNLEKDDI